MKGTGRPVVVGISGASGAPLARRTVDLLLGLGVPVICTITPAARMVWQEEMGESFGSVLEEWGARPGFTYYPVGDLRAPVASGTFPARGMAVVPCSMRTVSALAHGLVDNLLLRAAEVCLKEGRRLVVVPRETPLTPVHLENMARLARMGAVVLPPEPPFYLGLESLDQVVDFIAHRVLVALGVLEEMPARFQYHRRGE